MLLQSHLGEIHFLPALPASWSAGSFRGLRARGGVEVDLSWRGGGAGSAVLRSDKGRGCNLRPPPGRRITSVRCEGEELELSTNPDGSSSLATLPIGRPVELEFD
jgi:alpha-L-fucosidase 2